MNENKLLDFVCVRFVKNIGKWVEWQGWVNKGSFFMIVFMIQNLQNYQLDRQSEYLRGFNYRDVQLLFYMCLCRFFFKERMV